MGRWEEREGSSFPLGAIYLPEEDAFNFAIYSKHARRVTLRLYGDDTERPRRSVELDPIRNRTGRIWHCRLRGAELDGIRFYAYTVAGPSEPEPPGWHAFDPDKILLDPYAEEIHFPPRFDREAARANGSNAGRAALGVLCPRRRSAGPLKGARHEADLVIYELHVRGFTRHASSPVTPELRGTYAGLVEMIPYLLDLGVTAVELMPVFQHDPESGDYWGYSPMSFFAPHAGYASQAEESVADELTTLVDALHAAGIEVLLDVVYNHTAEGNHEGPIYSFKGIDNSTYYLCTDDPERPYLDYTGTGNTVHAANRHVRRMILDSLRHWTTVHGIDGFRFDLASIFTRDSRGEIAMGDEGSAIFGEIGADPGIATKRLIAEPWDAVGTYQLGRHFPGIDWYQWNGRFRDDVRRFVRGDPGMVGAVMCRIYGSDDLFPESPPDVFHPYQSVNFVSVHDGFTLYDLVAYERKHNEANGHGNTDGLDESFSANYGHEGDDGVPAEVVRLRLRQAKNLMAILLLANGVPMIRAGDEFLNTQGGNNNAYNQDNETSWIDWAGRERHAGMHRFVKEMIAFRKRHPSLCRSRYWRDDVRWFGAGGAEVDLSERSRAFGYLLRGDGEGDVDLGVFLNMGLDDLDVTLPLDDPARWRRVVDTSRSSPEDIVADATAPRLTRPTVTVRSRSVVVFAERRA